MYGDVTEIFLRVGTRSGIGDVPLFANVAAPVAPCASRQLPEKLKPEWHWLQPSRVELKRAIPYFAAPDSASCPTPNTYRSNGERPEISVRSNVAIALTTRSSVALPAESGNAARKAAPYAGSAARRSTISASCPFTPSSTGCSL